MKLIRHYLEAIEGVEIYAIIALVIFFSIFVIMLIHTLQLKNEDVKAFSEIPFDDDPENDDNFNKN